MIKLYLTQHEMSKRSCDSVSPREGSLSVKKTHRGSGVRKGFWDSGRKLLFKTQSFSVLWKMRRVYWCVQRHSDSQNSLLDCEREEQLRSQSKNAETMRDSAEERQALDKDA